MVDWYLAHAESGPARIGVGPAAAWQQWWREQAESAGNPLGRRAAEQGFVLLTGQLRSMGLAPHDIRRERRRGRLWSPALGVASPVVVAGDDLLAGRRRHALAATASVLLRGGVVAERSAAILHGLPTLRIPPVPELTAAAPDWIGRRRRSHLRHAALSPADRTTWFGAPVTTVARTVVDIARHDRRGGLMAADAALREHLTDDAELAGVLYRARGWPGVRQAREIVALADGDAESPLESITRLALHDDGFPPPRLQVWIAGYRVDFLWPQYRLVLEADGREKYRSSETPWEEKKRQLVLERAGYRVERVLWEDVVVGWPAMSNRLRALMR
ncbi:MAG TPA: DUF559 domain-containing protein [Jatrophihabitans sp.]|jgi:very-short-patch-repair endonuclease|nr:DUF559 domain-containing protein [Jatrophihabitans sp.]